MNKKQVAVLVLVFWILPGLGAFCRIIFGNNTYTNMGLIIVLAIEGIVIGKIVYDSFKRKRRMVKS